MLTPLRIVAPVGGEVVLLAGICGEDGYLVNNEPLEWMLTPESVGTFLEVGDDTKGRKLVSWTKKPKVEKLDVDFAKGRTSARESRITRGSASPNDDLLLKEGQTWISLTSPVEGVSRITALAPDSEIWNKRRQTATVYWIDAQWQFPPPQSMMIGESATLITRVVIGQGIEPARGWTVKYRSLNPAIARFAPSDSEIALVPVADDGTARVQLVNVSNGPASIPVAIEVVRDARPGDNFPELPVGRGETLVSWSAPQLQLLVSGPSDGSPGEPLTYVASLANAGDLAADNVQLRLNVPTGMTLQRSDQQPRQITNQIYEWDIGQIPARQQFNVALDLVPQGENTFAVRFDASGAGGLNATDEIITRVERPTVQLSIQPETSSSQVEVGQQARLNIAVRNTGRRALPNLTVKVQAPEALQHVVQNSNQIELNVSGLLPGETAPLVATFRVNGEGSHQIRALVEANGVQLGEDLTTIIASPPRPKVPNAKLVIRSENRKLQLASGQTDVCEFIIDNDGDVPLTGIQFNMEYGAGLSAVQASEGPNWDAAARTMEWKGTLPNLQPGQIARLRVQFRANGQSPDGRIAAQVTTAEQVSASGFYDYTLSSAANDLMPNSPDQPGATTPPQRNPNVPGSDLLPNSQPGGAPLLPNTGSNSGDSVLPDRVQPPTSNPDSSAFALELFASVRIATVQQPFDISMVVSNLSNEMQRDLDITVEVIGAVDIVAISPSERLHQYLATNLVRFDRIRSVRSGERIETRLTLRPNLAGPIRMLVRVSSPTQPEYVREIVLQAETGV